jgi:hypothetical protein
MGQMRQLVLTLGGWIDSVEDSRGLAPAASAIASPSSSPAQDTAFSRR